MDDSEADVVVNCLGLLQDVPATVPRYPSAFVDRLTAALRAADAPVLFVHLSIPDRDR